MFVGPNGGQFHHTLDGHFYPHTLRPETESPEASGNSLAKAMRCNAREKCLENMVPVERIELPTFGLQNRCSTAELNRLTQ
jgi:hypothetical protein